MAFIFEKKAYHEGASKEVIEAIKERVSIYKKEIILTKELPVVSPFSLKHIFEQMATYASASDNCAYLIDLTETSIPNAESRRFVNQKFKETLSNVKHVSFVTGKNIIINTTAHFVMYQTHLKSFSIVKTLEAGEKKIEKVLNEWK